MDPEVTAERTEQLQTALMVAKRYSRKFNLVNCLVSHVLPKGMLSLSKRQAQVVAAYTAIPTLQTSEFEANGSFPMGGWSFGVQGQKHAVGKTTVKTSVVKAKAFLGPCRMKFKVCRRKSCRFCYTTTYK